MNKQTSQASSSFCKSRAMLKVKGSPLFNMYFFKQWERSTEEIHVNILSSFCLLSDPTCSSQDPGSVFTLSKAGHNSQPGKALRAGLLFSSVSCSTQATSIGYLMSSSKLLEKILREGTACFWYPLFIEPCLLSSFSASRMPSLN